MNCLDNNPLIVYSKELEGRLCRGCILFDLVENNVNQGIFVKRAFRDFSEAGKIRSMLKHNITTMRFYMLESS